MQVGAHAPGSRVCLQKDFAFLWIAESKRIFHVFPQRTKCEPSLRWQQYQKNFAKYILLKNILCGNMAEQPSRYCTHTYSYAAVVPAGSLHVRVAMLGLQENPARQRSLPIGHSVLCNERKKKGGDWDFKWNAREGLHLQPYLYAEKRGKVGTLNEV